MKYKANRTTGKAGVIYVEQIVNDHGSIFRPVHQEDDFGIDGYIELVHSEEVSGRLIAVQIKSGDSYISKNKSQFEIDVNDRHLQYWRDFMVPVILVCYSPSNNIAAWVSVRDYIEREEYNNRAPLKKIVVAFSDIFDKKALSKGIAGLAHVRADERLLIKCAEMCLSFDKKVRRQGFEILQQHPDSRDLKITCLMARRLILDEDIETAKDALDILGYGVGRRRWSWNPNNNNELETISFVSHLCSDLSPQEIRRLVELVDVEYFNGPQGLGERCFDVLRCCFETTKVVLEEIASDRSLPLQRRINALYLLFECNDNAIEESFEELCKNPNLIDVVAGMFREEILEALESES